MKVLIKTAKVIAPESPFHQKTVDILIDNGKISKIGTDIKTNVDQEFTADNLHVSTGWFDSSVSFGEPGYEERETLENGLLTAAKSGFSAIALNPDMNPVSDQHSAIDFLKNKATNSATKLYPIGALTQKSEGEELAEMYDMFLAGAVAFGDYKKSVQNTNLLKIALQYAQGFDGLVQAFPNEHTLSKNGVMNEGKVSASLGLKGIPTFVEELQISRDLAVLEYTGGKLHIPTISTVKSVELIEEAKKKGLDVSCSVAIHNLFFTDDSLCEFDSVFKVIPPLRTEKDRKALVEAVKNNVIDMVTSDHRPLDIENKKLEFEHAEFGSLGLESAFGALNKVFGTQKSIALLTRGRERFKIQPPKIEEGKEANLTLFDPLKIYSFKEKDIYSSTKNSMFLSTELQGKALGIFANNRLILV